MGRKATERYGVGKQQYVKAPTPDAMARVGRGPKGKSASTCSRTGIADGRGCSDNHG
jgi:hypothetical protein